MKTWHWILIGVAVVVLMYLLLARKTLVSRPTSTSSLGSLGGSLAGVGSAATGLSNLWDSIFNSDKESEDEEE